MNTQFTSFLIKLALAVGKQAAIAGTPVALAVAEALASLIVVAVKVGVSVTLSIEEKKELYRAAWQAVLTTVTVCEREGALLAEEVVTLVADAAAADVESALGITPASMASTVAGALGPQTMGPQDA